MKTVTTIKQLKEIRHALGNTVGFVPTMGFLHDGHLELVRTSTKNNDTTIVSIFVNPTQFAPNEDFRDYPRNTKLDLELLESVKTDIVFMPSAEEMYPNGFNTWVEVREITQKLEGKSRPTHFQGVATVCNKLFNMVEPRRAYFGQKDAQQVRVIQKMVADLNMNLEIVVIPTIRESDGLAMSSRNVYLNKEERAVATILFKAINLADEMYSRGERNAASIRNAMTSLISAVPQAKIDYISVADNDTLAELDSIKDKALVSLAVKIGKPRLLDNIILG